MLVISILNQAAPSPITRESLVAILGDKATGENTAEGEKGEERLREGKREGEGVTTTGR